MTRNYHLDNTKFFLIFCVIIGHTLARLGGSDLCKSVDASVYFYHMPLMIFISGYFSKRTDGGHFIKNILRLLEPLIVFNTLQLIILFIMGNMPEWKQVLLIPRWSLWYLVSLLFWRIIVQINITPPSLWIIGGAVSIGIISGFVPLGRPLSFQRTCSLLPFFITGYYCGRKGIDLTKVKRIPKLVALFVLLSLPFITYYIDFPFKLFLEGVEPYGIFVFPQLGSAMIRLLLYVVCALASICILCLIPEKKISLVSTQGKDSLLYYLYHTLIIYGIISIGSNFILPNTFLAVLGYAVLIVIFIWTITRIPFFRDLPFFFTKILKINKMLKI